MESELDFADPQWFTSIGPHSFGFPSKLESGNVLSWPLVRIGPSRALFEMLNFERKQIIQCLWNCTRQMIAG
jgi:hypothetical protein